MPPLIFTTLVPRTSKVAGSDNHSFAPLELADKKINSAPSNQIYLSCLILSITLLLVVFISSFVYRILASHKEDTGRSSPRSAKSRNAYHSRDIEKGLSSSRGLKGRISGPTLLFGTSVSTLNDFVNRESKSRRDMDITEALSEHNESPFLAIENGYSGDAMHRCKHGIDTLKTGDDVSPSRIEDVQISSMACPVTESGDSAILEEYLDPFATDAPKHNVIAVRNGHIGKCAGYTEDDCYPYRNSSGTCDDDFTVIMTALERLADTFHALESLEKELGTGQNGNDICYEECAFGSMPPRCGIPDVRQPGNPFTDIQECEGTDYLRLGITQPYRAFESKEDAQAVLFRRRVELQRRPELASVVHDPIARDVDSYVHATEPELRPPKMMRPESILKEKRCIDASRPSRAHRPVLTSPLASGYVIFGPGFSRSKPYRTGSQRPAPLRRKAKSLSPVKNSRHGCGLAHSSSVSSQRSPDKLAVHLLKRRQSQVHASVNLKAPPSPAVSSNATKAQVRRRRGMTPIAASIDASRASPLSAPSAVTQQPKCPFRTTHSPTHFEKTTRTLMNAGVDHVPSIGDPGLQSLPAYSDEAAETSSSRNKPALLTSKASPRKSRCLTDAPLPQPSPISVEHTDHPSNKVLIPSPSPPKIQPHAEKESFPCVFTRPQALDNSPFCCSSTPSHNSQTRRAPTKTSLRKHRQPSPAPSESRIYRGPPTVARITRRDDEPSFGQNVSLSKNGVHCELAPEVSSATPPVKRRGLSDISNSAVVNRSAASSRYSPLVVRPSVMSASRDVAAMHSRKSSSSSSDADATGVGKNIRLLRRSLAGVPPRSSVFSSSTSALY